MQHFRGNCGLRNSFEKRANLVSPALLKAFGVLGTPVGKWLSEVLFTHMFEAAAFHKPPRSIPSSSARPRWEDIQCQRCDGRCRTCSTGLLTPRRTLKTSESAAGCWSCWKNLVIFYDCLFANGLWLSDAASVETRRCLLEVPCQHQALTQNFMVSGRSLFHLTEKVPST